MYYSEKAAGEFFFISTALTENQNISALDSPLLFSIILLQYLRTMA